MQYMGSKSSIVKKLLPFMLQHRADNMPWVEPFVGGANMIDKVGGERIGYDVHSELIALLLAVQQGWKPPTNITRELYYDIKTNSKDYEPYLVGFVGFLCSFGGKWWGGYACNSKGDNYAERGSRVLQKQAKSLQNVVFATSDYRDVSFDRPSFIYCDPPYAGTTRYDNKFDSENFFHWCRSQRNNGHIIFVSEYNAPDDFILVTELPTKTKLDKNSQYQRTEKLFTLPR